MPTAPSPSSSATRPIRLGTRGSKLAMWQSHWVKSKLEQLGVPVEMVVIKTDGDIKTGPLAQIGGQGLFTKRLQVALLDNEIDLAVHSLKDLPTEDHPNLTIAAVPVRENTADAWISNKFKDLASLPHGATVGTGSVRRAAQLLHLKSDLNICDIRGNVDTRLQKLDDGEFDAIVLACAGLVRLGLNRRIAYEFSPNELMPAVGQGALGLETRSLDANTIRQIASLNDLESYHRTVAERSMLRTLFAGCLSPVGASTTVTHGQLTLTGVVLSRDGRERVYASQTQKLEQSAELGKSVAAQLSDGGANKHLKQ